MAPSLRLATSLDVEGDWRFEPGVVIEGDVTFEAGGGTVQPGTYGG